MGFYPPAMFVFGDLCFPIASFIFLSVSGFVLGIKGPEEDKPGSSGSATCGHRVCR